LQYNNAGTFGGMSGTSWDDTNRSLTITGATVTTNSPILTLTQAWNAAAAFSGVVINISSVGAATTGSYPLDVKVGGSQILGVRKDGALIAVGTIAGPGFSANTDTAAYRIGVAGDVVISRFGGASSRLGNVEAASPVAQTLGVQGSSGTDAAAAATFTIKGPMATGTALPGDVLIQTGTAVGSGTTASTATTALTIKGGTQTVIAAAQLVPGSGTKAQMDALTGVEGGLFNVTDQLTVCPVKGAGFTGGGNKTCLAHFEEGAWVAP
jgi:hypothetical protein